MTKADIAENIQTVTEQSRYLSTSDFTLGNGTADLYISVADLANMKEIQINK